jgi:dTDP-4-amino-4,6-dideoxygalactose transaminase
MQIPFVDLKTQYQNHKDEIRSAIDEVLDRGDFILGRSVIDFEESFKRYTSSKYAVSCANGTDALILSLDALDIKTGDEVISVANTWVSTIFAISRVGARPVFVDIDPKTYLMDPNKIESAITKKTKAILPVHLYGQSADIEAISSIASKNNLMVLEDAAQAHGSRWKESKPGSLTKAACYSFYPGKNLGAYGDAGCVTTNDEEFARRLRMLGNLGQSVKHNHELIGTNSRLDTLQAAILNVKLKYLDSWIQKRREAAKRYNELLKNIDCITPQEHENSRHVYHLYVIQVKNRDNVVNLLQSKGVMAQIHYPTPIHMQKCYSHLGVEKGALPITEEISKNIISLPIFPEITEEQQTYVAESLQAIITR